MDSGFVASTKLELKKLISVAIVSHYLPANACSPSDFKNNAAVYS